VLPASSLPPSSSGQAMAYADPAPTPQQQSKPAAVHSGWIVQVGALESEDEAQHRIEAARNQAHGLLSKADPFTEPVIAKGERKLFRARFAGLDRDQAEAVCKALKRADISCMTVRN
jgi:D-alanyl-D-alanine carboxypeptidase